ncbi:hypothetical protein AGMMS49949_02090 [Alphaproteobacteria bacterium]|nr:hypothetical protein AGMMS49949_02090 [Alphaproteobacteria bacterium]GHS95908.1 hypothetical protein AGMMS50296_1400 [Alphaproteobacteria bacterium]
MIKSKKKRGPGPQPGTEQQRQRCQSLQAKFITLGKEAASQGERVEAERFFQYAEHYTRVLNSFQERLASQRTEDGRMNHENKEPESDSLSVRFDVPLVPTKSEDADAFLKASDFPEFAPETAPAAEPRRPGPKPLPRYKKTPRSFPS